MNIKIDHQFKTEFVFFQLFRLLVWLLGLERLLLFGMLELF